MGTLWRSQPMCLAQILVQADVVYESVRALGELGLVQFKDLNPEVNAFQRKFVNEVRRCDEMDRKLRFFEAEAEKGKIRVQDAEDALDTPAPETSEFTLLENNFQQLERELKEINSNEETLRKQQLELLELKEILSKSRVFFEEAEHIQPNLASTTESNGDLETSSLVANENADRGQLRFVAGVIVRTKIPGFERLLWRACRGNVFFRHIVVDENLKDPVTGKELQKDVFIVFFQGDQLEGRVRKICEGYSATLYPCPNTPAERRELAARVDTRLSDLQEVLARTNDHRKQMLQKIAFDLPSYIVKVRKAKAIYHTMNKFNIDASRKCLIGECWCPVNRFGDIQNTLRQASNAAGSTFPSIIDQIRTKEKPPTYHLTNKFTEGFQGIIDAYGIASYREVNPGCFTIITFPFLFAVMFGDLGHGFLMALAAWFMIKKEESLYRFRTGGEIWNTMFGGRYIIFLMGLFSMYTGLLYNDCFAKSLTIAEAGWMKPNLMGNSSITYDKEEIIKFSPYGNGTVTGPGSDFDHAYVLGIDPIWSISENKLTFTNSFKMKLSVILGITHMMFGVILSYCNASFFKRKMDIIHVFIPQVLFLGCIFGYLVIMIFYKWANSNFIATNTFPSLLLMLINMFLKFGKAPLPDQVLYGDASGSTQKNLQTILVIIAVLCVPWMLLVKPFLLKAQHKKRMQQLPYHAQGNGAAAGGDDDALLNAEDEEDHGGHGGHGDGDHFEFGEIMVHQAIHTIEYCLGCISNTASYLRLWALSLAHSQLSEVLWQMILRKSFGNPAFLFVGFGAWAVLTVAVLLIMEGLSAFLHALRLHWVEFNGKFYEGAGYKFTPFALKRVLKTDAEDM